MLGRSVNLGHLTYESDALPTALHGPVIRLNDRPNMTIDVLRGRKTITQQDFIHHTVPQTKRSMSHISL